MMNISKMLSESLDQHEQCLIQTAHIELAFICVIVAILTGIEIHTEFKLQFFVHLNIKSNNQSARLKTQTSVSHPSAPQYHS